MRIRIRGILGIVLFAIVATPVSAQSATELPAEYTNRLAELQQSQIPSEFVAVAGPLISDAKNDLPPTLYEYVLNSVGDGAKVWLLNVSTISTASPGDIDLLLLWGENRLTPQQQESLAVSWLLEHSAATRLSPQAVGRLIKWGSRRLTDTQRNQLLQSIDAQFPEIGAMTFAQLDDRMQMTAYLVDRSYENIEQRRELVAQWVRANDISDLDARTLDRLILHYLSPMIQDFKEFQVDWSGEITPPQSGTYVFSVSPFNINTEFDDAVHRQKMTVDLGGQTVVSADANNWAADGTPVDLTRNQPVSLHVQLTYSMRSSRPRVAPAQLYWAGPGFTRQLVPTTVLTRLQGGQGLSAVARWTDTSQTEHVKEVIVPDVDDVFWGSTLCTYDDVFQPLVSRRISQLLSDPQGEAQPPPPDLFINPHRHRHLLRFCTSAERKLCAQRLLEQPQLITGGSMSRMLLLYNSLRFGAEREALDLLGMWLAMNADLPPTLAGSLPEYSYQNRRIFRKATISLVWEHPESIKWLEEDYLETSDGRCVLPAAYTLAYAYLVKGKLKEWVERLEGKLAAPETTGDRRVNWLLARAQAAEIRRSPPSRHVFGQEQPFAGRAWLDEAALVAESANTRLRVSKERIARLVAIGNWDAAEGEIDADPPLAAAWGETFAALRQQMDDLAEKRSNESDAAYLEELEKRRRLAINRGDNTAAQSYDNLISAAQSGQ